MPAISSERAVRRIDAGQPSRKEDVLLHREVREQVEGLEHETDLPGAHPAQSPLAEARTISPRPRSSETPSIARTAVGPLP